MANKLAIQLVIPDAGVLISLAHGDLLELLLSFSADVRLVVTDVVMFEANRRTDKFDSGRIADFLGRHSTAVKVDATGFHQLLEQARGDASLALPRDIGEMSIYGYINALRNQEPGLPTLVLFEDKWFMDNQYARPRNVHLLSLAAFLRFLEQVLPGFSFEDAMARIRNTRPQVQSAELDIAADSSTSWKSRVGQNR